MTTPISVVIPDYKGLNLLQANLPTVVAELVDGDEIIISEDAADERRTREDFVSRYQLQPVVRQQVPGQVWQKWVTMAGKKIHLVFLQRAQNGRFARNVNDAVKLVNNRFFLLLNNDVQLQKGVREQLLGELADEKVFAVTAREIDVHDGHRESGRNKLWWRAGRFWHSRDEDVHSSGETAWACGGSSMYRTAYWRELGGFDTRYYPAYWEDIDVSWQARARGYKVLYKHTAVVNHVHETTNATVFGRERMIAMSWQAGTKFAWKNSNWWQKCQFILMYPYWLLKQYPQLWWWVGVVAVCALTRLAVINTPHGLTVDEAAIGYNAYGIWTQRRDEWANKLPVSFRSYGDFKAPLAIYATAPWVGMLGMRVWSVRLSFVLAGIMSVWGLMKLVDELLFRVKPNHQTWAAAAGFLMTVSPWHYHFSHLGFENNWALVGVLWGMYGWLKFVHARTNWRGKLLSETWWSAPLLGSGVALVAALYSYHAAKVVVPLFVLAALIGYWPVWRARWRSLAVALMVAVVLAWPLLAESIWGEGFTRAGSSFMFDAQVPWSQKATMLVSSYTAHWQPAYLWAGQLYEAQTTTGQWLANVRHGDGAHGILTLAETSLILLLIASVTRLVKCAVMLAKQ